MTKREEQAFSKSQGDDEWSFAASRFWNMKACGDFLTVALFRAQVKVSLVYTVKMSLASLVPVEADS